jgi:DNA polymerase III epsilon subunit-like protein
MSVFKNYYFIWDTETTSNNPNMDDIISLGGILCTYQNSKFHKIAEFNSFISTNKKIDVAAQAIHHITKSDLQGKPEFPDVVRMLRTFLQQHQSEPNSRVIFVGHNAKNFDLIVFYCNFVQHRLDFDQFLRDVKFYGSLDSLVFLKALFKNCSYKESPKDNSTGRTSFALGHCFTSFCNAKELEGAHDALVDSQALLDILNSPAVSQRVNLQNLFKYVENYQKTVKWIKQKAGTAFQNKEQQTRLAKTQTDGPPPIDEKIPKHPVFEADFSGNSAYHRLCLVCMQFVKKEEHLRCESDPQSAQKNMQHIVDMDECDVDDVDNIRPESPADVPEIPDEIVE